MEKTLKEVISTFLKKDNAYETNEYFATEFVDDLKHFEKDDKNKKAIDFLIDTSYEIDCNNYSDIELSYKIKEMLKNALELIKLS